MNISKLTQSILAVLVMLMAAASAEAEEFDLQKASLADRMTYHRAIDAAVWAMPLMNFKFYRDSLADNGVGPFDVGYNFYTYPGADDLDYGEFYVGAAYGDAEVYWWYTNDFFALDESAFYLEGNYSIALPEAFSLDLHVGYTAGDGLEADVESGLQEYIDYAVAISRSFGNFDGEIRYVNTDLPNAFEVDSRVIISISTTFPWGGDE